MLIITPEKREEFDKMSIEFLKKRYPNALHLLPKKGIFVSNYCVCDYFETSRKEGSGNFFEFIEALANMSNSYAVNSIKKIFDIKNINLVYDKKNPTHALYPIGVGIFDGIKYKVSATSMNKYIKENYVIEIIND